MKMLSESYKKMIGLISKEEEEKKHYPYETELKDVCIIQVNFSKLQNILEAIKQDVLYYKNQTALQRINKLQDSLH